MDILVVDGQGGRIGAMLIEQIKSKYREAEIVAVGTNGIATAAMLKAGADNGATGENPVVYNSKRAKLIIGPIGIVMANALLGEITPKMAQAIGESDAYKILIPVNKCNHYIAGTENLPLGGYIKAAVEKAGEVLQQI